MLPDAHQNKRARVQQDGGFINATTFTSIRQSQRTATQQSNHINVPTVNTARPPVGAPEPAADEWANDDDDDDHIDIQALLPNDTEAAIQLLISQFPSQQPSTAAPTTNTTIPPFALKTQLYSVLEDKTLADRQLDELRYTNKIRVFKLATGADDYALMPVSEYRTAILAAFELNKQQATSTSTTNASGNTADTNTTNKQQQQTKASSSSVASSSKAAEVVTRFIERVLPACQDVSITHTQLIQLLTTTPPLTNSGGGGGNTTGGIDTNDTTTRNGERPTTTTSVSTKKQQQQQQPISPTKRKLNLQRQHQAAISLLLRIGCLIRHIDNTTNTTTTTTTTNTIGNTSIQYGGGGSHHQSEGEQRYLFAIPGAGTAVVAISTGRKEVLGILKRRHHPEILMSELEKKKLRGSVLGVKFHVRDLLGSGVLCKVDTTVGDLIRITQR